VSAQDAGSVSVTRPVLRFLLEEGRAATVRNDFFNNFLTVQNDLFEPDFVPESRVLHIFAQRGT
jgi:hypothetical protein